MTCFMPVFALFAAWLHEKKWVRTWMELTAVAAAALWLVWHVAGDDVRMERLAAFFNPGDWLDTRAYMARQLQMAFDSANWFGGAGKSLGLLAWHGVQFFIFLLALFQGILLCLYLAMSLILLPFFILLLPHSFFIFLLDRKNDGGYLFCAWKS